MVHYKDAGVAYVFVAGYIRLIFCCLSLSLEIWAGTEKFTDRSIQAPALFDEKATLQIDYCIT